ncbi:MAG: hypothetical protein WAW39_15960 [Prosthecobacter sp.]|uniref:hypothetical protein n=1 Tax=Prosthecobacter sp. TaxID=1965333 RepID=UPI003BAE1CC5
MNNRYPPVPPIVGARPRFKYSAPWSECRIIHERSCMGTRLLIVGDPDCGGYEWVILISGEVVAHSNDGYGISEVALRDGLIEAFKDCFTAEPNPAFKADLEKSHSLLTSIIFSTLPAKRRRQIILAASEATPHHAGQCVGTDDLLQPAEKHLAAKMASQEGLFEQSSGVPLQAVENQTSERPRCGTSQNQSSDKAANEPPQEHLQPSEATSHERSGTAMQSSEPPQLHHPALRSDEQKKPGSASAASTVADPLTPRLPPKSSVVQKSAPTSSAKPGASAAAGKQTAEDSCGDINCDGLCHLR